MKQQYLLSTAVFIMKAIGLLCSLGSPSELGWHSQPCPIYTLTSALRQRCSVFGQVAESRVQVSTAVDPSQRQLPAAQVPHAQLSIMD